MVTERIHEQCTESSATLTLAVQGVNDLGTEEEAINFVQIGEGGTQGEKVTFEPHFKDEGRREWWEGKEGRNMFQQCHSCCYSS